MMPTLGRTSALTVLVLGALFCMAVGAPRAQTPGTDARINNPPAADWLSWRRSRTFPNRGRRPWHCTKCAHDVRKRDQRADFSFASSTSRSVRAGRLASLATVSVQLAMQPWRIDRPKEANSSAPYLT